MRLLNKRFLLRLSIATVLVFSASLYWPINQGLFDRPSSKLLLDKNDKILSVIIAGDEQFRFPMIGAIPDNYIEALLTFEDKRFYSHFGIDPFAIVSAAYKNITHGKVVSGGSTITMQLARMMYGNKPRTFSQKLKEAYLALRIEAQLSKASILERYVQFIPMGGNTVGLETAAWRYYGRPLSDLTWAESALFSVLPNSPGSIHLQRGQERLLHKRNALLLKLHMKGIISATDYSLSLLEKIPRKPIMFPQIARPLLSSLAAEKPDTHVFRSTLSQMLAYKHEFILKQHQLRLAGIGVNNIALVVIDNNSLNVLSYFPNVTTANKSSNARFVDIANKPRTSASTLKPFLYASMLDEGMINPDTLIPDIPTSYGAYQPTNYDKSYRGAVKASDALITSLNVPAVRMLQEYSHHKFYTQLKLLGFKHLFRAADEYGLSLILGGAEVSLVELATAYAHLSKQAQGQTITGKNARFLEADSELIGQANKVFPISQGAAWLTLTTLLDVKRPGLDNLHQQYIRAQPIYWKTGTSYGLRDAWAIGTSKEYTVAVWAGNANGEGRHQLTGTTAAAPVLFDIFNSLEGISLIPEPEVALKVITVCDDNGLLPSNNCKETGIKIPIDSTFEKISRQHYQVNIDNRTQRRVTINCSNDGYKRKTFFELPPSQAYFYKKYNSAYDPVPRFKDGCNPSSNLLSNELEIIYPGRGQKIIIPRYLNSELGEVVLKANSKSEDEELFWHLDNEYLGSTKTFHEMSVQAFVGKHEIRVISESGSSRRVKFSIVY